MSRASKKIILPDPSVRSVMIKYLEKTGEINFDKIFNQRLGYLLFKDFCLNVANEQVCTLGKDLYLFVVSGEPYER